MRRAPFVPLLVLAAASPLHALAIRTYNATVHNRFTGFPQAPVMNPGFLFTASRFTGVGWCNQAAHQQFTLVTPRHFLFARHAVPTVGSTLSFVGSDGVVVVRTITGFATISNDTGGDSDLVVGTLDSPVPSTVKTLPWLNLNSGSETSYRTLSLMVLGFGKDANGTIAVAGAGTLLGFSTVTEDGIDATRMSSFSYSNVGTNANDCHFEGGDSGGPTFATATNGEPALVGTHSSIASVGVAYQNYDTFLPHYVTKVDALLAASGYRVRPANATATTVALASAAASASLRQSHGGSVSFTVANTGAALTGNVELVLSFPAGAAPDSIAMPGWVVEPRGNGVWSLRSATLGAGASGVATATWTTLPGVSTLQVTTTLDSDATDPVTAVSNFPLLPSYAQWAQGLTDAGETADPDGDGVPNLMEYALGGDPASGVLALANGQPELPQLATTADGHLDFSFPLRSDAAQRGLSYAVETSTTLDAGSWTTTLPDQAVESQAQPEPALDGFLIHHVIWPAAPEPLALFLRLRVDLNETP